VLGVVDVAIATIVGLLQVRVFELSEVEYVRFGGHCAKEPSDKIARQKVKTCFMRDAVFRQK
jgi:hypothetical protein